MPSIQRDAILAQVSSILQKPNFDRSDSSRAENLLALADALDPHKMELRRAQLTQLELDAGMRTPRTAATNEVHQNFLRALRHGAILLPDEKRAQTVGVGAEGGYLASAEFSDSLYRNMAVFDRLFDPAVVDIQTTSGGNAFTWPVLDDTTASSTIIQENGEFLQAADPVFDAPMLLAKASTWRADLILCSMELLADSAFDIGGLLATSFAIRLSRGIGSSFMATLLSEATVGKQAASGQTSSIIYEDIVDMVASVNEIYRQSPKCGWMCRQTTVDAIAKLKDSNNRPLRLIEYSPNRVPFLWGYPIYVSPSAPALGPGSPAVGNQALLFGDFNAWKVRKCVDGLRIRRLAERFALNGQIGFTATLRCNGALGKASSADSPIKYFQNAAS